MRTFERKTARGGFTLIEMLVVIVIIVILMAVVFRLTRGAMAKSEFAKEQALVTKVRTLIEDFHAEYNIYPPVPEYATHDGEIRQPINFRGACPDGTETPGELRTFSTDWSYAKKSGEDCYFIFGLLSFFVDRSGYVLRQRTDQGRRAFDVNGVGGIRELREQWNAYNDAAQGSGGNVKIVISQKDKAFAHRVWPIVSELCGCEGMTFDNPKIWQEYDPESGYCKGFTTHVYGQWADGIGFVYRNNREEKVYDEGLVYISKPPYSTYLLFSKGPDRDYDHAHPEDRTRPKNKDNVYGNLGDK